ncbi:hypothetical protein EDC96DRAFT_494745 [Choanephora cucurbitarum]|nr:hypothetical protein EDC96DRAFT_494745 [Choanephora cucurbitarum]
MQQELRSMRLLVEQLRDKKRQSESHYHRVASVPLLSSQSRKRYLKAHSRNAKAEQQLSEAREALEKCKDQLRAISNARSRQSMEQDLLASQRRGSLDAIQITQQQLAFLREGSAFWTEFDDDQARVVLESAEYLIALDEKTEASEHEKLDIDQLWLKTFRFACFEYGDRESEGLRVWGGPDQTEILFECAQCQLVCNGWPKIANDNELICSLCLESPAMNFMKNLMNRQSRMIESTSRLRKMVRNLFSYSKIEPLSPV